nr:M15 family metallopeptidase [Gordonia hirsuta]
MKILVLAIAAVSMMVLALVAAPQAGAAPPPVAGQQGSAAALTAPGTAGLRWDLAIAYTLASTEARASGVPMHITSGKRSRAQQAALWRQGLATYGDPAVARRWVLPPGESTHETGEAIDVGPRAGAAWLQRHGARYGLCRPFDNEWWHFERLTVPGLPCPPRVADASVRSRR